MTGGILDRIAGGLDRLAPGFVRRRFAAKFAIAFLAVLVVIAGAGAFAFQATSAAVERQTTEQLAETSQLEGDAIGSWVEQQRTHTRSVSQGEPLQADRTAAAYILLQDQLLPADVVSMHLVNSTRDEVVASTELPLEGRALSELDAPWTTADVPEGPGNNSDVWSSSRSYRSPVLNDEPVMAFASSVPKRDGSYLVVVTRIQGQVDRLTSANSTKRTTILNTDDETVLNIEREFDTDAHAASLASIRDANGTVAPVTAVSGGRVYAFAPVPNTDWVTVTSLDTGRAFAVRDTVGETVGLLVLLALVSLSVVGVVLGRRTVGPLKRLRDRAERIEAGEFDVDLSTSRVDEIGRLYGSFDDMRHSLQERIEEAERAVDEAETARQEAESLRTEAEAAQSEAERAKEDAEAARQRLQQRATEYSAVMQEVAAGDLTKRLDEDAEAAAMQEVATEFNAMLDGIEATVGEVAGFADEVAAATLEVATGAEEIETTSQTVSERIQEIADGAIEQHDDLETAAGEMDELSASIQEVAASSATVADTAVDAVERGEAGRDAAESALGDMAEIEELSADAVEQILELQERMADIGEIVDFITDIAEQTNMLALNANIEAARADQSGDGFAVVADEVKDLAEETKAAAAEIEAEIETVREETDETVADIRATSDHIDTGVETVREAASAIEDTVDAIEDANHGIQEISDATDDQADATQNVVRRVDEVAEISQQVTEDAEQVSAAAEEQSASVAEIARSADELRERADSLSASVDQFETRDREADAAAPEIAAEAASDDDD